MDWREHIAVDPQILFGKPLIKETRVSVELVIDLLAAGWTHQQVLDSNHIAAPGKRKRSEFIQQAIQKSGSAAPADAMREAYRKQSDSIADADDWSTGEDYKGLGNEL